MIFFRKIIFFVSDGACLLPTKAGDSQIEINEHTDIEAKDFNGITDNAVPLALPTQKHFLHKIKDTAIL